MNTYNIIIGIIDALLALFLLNFAFSEKPDSHGRWGAVALSILFFISALLLIFSTY